MYNEPLLSVTIGILEVFLIQHSKSFQTFKKLQPTEKFIYLHMMEKGNNFQKCCLFALTTVKHFDFSSLFLEGGEDLRGDWS